jgi:hypothetical protein
VPTETFESETRETILNEDEVRPVDDDPVDEFGEVGWFLSDSGIEHHELLLTSVVEREADEHDARVDVVSRHSLEQGNETRVSEIEDRLV